MNIKCDVIVDAWLGGELFIQVVKFEFSDNASRQVVSCPSVCQIKSA